MQFTAIQYSPEKASLRRAVLHSSRRKATRGERNDKLSIFKSALAGTGRNELKRVRVDLDDGVVQLRGLVTSYYLKQVAQETVRPLAIGLEIDNQIRVTE